MSFSPSKNAGIDIARLRQEFDDITRFIYILNQADSSHKNWMDFCKEERNGRQDIEEMYKLMKSLSPPNPWRFLVDMETGKSMRAAIESIAGQ